MVISQVPLILNISPGYSIPTEKAANTASLPPITTGGSFFNPSSEASSFFNRPVLVSAGSSFGSSAVESPKQPAMSSFQVMSFLVVLYRAVKDAEEGSMAKVPLSHFAIKVFECPKIRVLLKISGRLSFIQRILAREQPPATGILAVAFNKASNPTELIIRCAWGRER